ncbi:MAG TPA: RICIN domain-containing protein [Streptosporangiaceae bacterium]|nr:RICIN domain-containing protein [Streptosporangiaceae bacterium]
MPHRLSRCPGRAGGRDHRDAGQRRHVGAQVWQPQSDGALLNPQSGKCLDDTGFSTTPGTQVQIWSCTGAANQSWVQP